MKQFINIFISIYIALVTCYPCSDNDACADDHGSRAEMISTDASNHEVDLCSPFCICSCCGSIINQPKYYSFVFYLPKCREFNAAVKADNITTLSYAIWQPPRLS